MSVEKLQWMDETNPDVVKIRELHGKQHEWPKFFRPMKSNDGRHGLLGMYSPDGIEYRQLNNEDPEKMKQLRKSSGLPNWQNGRKDPNLPLFFSGHFFFFYNGTGIAFGHVGPDYGGPRYQWFEFGCDHKMEHQATVGNCLNTYKCSVCGYTETIDSSD